MDFETYLLKVEKILKCTLTFSKNTNYWQEDLIEV